MFINNDFMLKRMADILEGDTSNREYIYTTILNKWYYSDRLINLLFGYGLAGSMVLAGGLAHNDWLELLSNFGVVGIFAYMFLFYSALQLCFNKDWILDKRFLMISMVVMWFLVTLISMWYTSLNFFTYSMIFGFLTGSESNNLV